jgi:hypothetical protein
MARVLTCTEFDELTQECTASVWLEEPTLLPELSVEDARLIGEALLLCWLVAYLLKKLIRWSEKELL